MALFKASDAISLRYCHSRACSGGGCKEKNSSASGGPPRLTLMLDWKPEPEFGGFYAAQESGAFEKHGLNVKIKSGGSGSPMWQLVASKQTDFATTAADQLLIGRDEGADVVALFAVYQTFPQGVMVHESRGLQVAGRRLHFPRLVGRGGRPLAQILPGEISAGKGERDPRSVAGSRDFWPSRDFSQQCFVTSEPFLARRQGGDPQTFLIVDEGYNPYTTVVITRTELLRSDPGKVSAMIDACREGWQAYLDNPGPTNAVMGKLNPDMDAQSFHAGRRRAASADRNG